MYGLSEAFYKPWIDAIIFSMTLIISSNVDEFSNLVSSWYISKAICNSLYGVENGFCCTYRSFVNS